MKTNPLHATWLILAAAFGCVAGASQVEAQQLAPSVRQPSGYQRLSGLSNPAVEYFGGGIQHRQSRPLARTQIPMPRSVSVAPTTKPFSNVPRGPAVSPYLALDMVQDAESVPNYFAYVRPQLERQQAVQKQARQMRQMEQQLRMAQMPGVATSGLNGGLPTTGHSSQFMNTGSYYRVRR